MAYSSSSSDSGVSNDSTCSKSCLETVEVLKSQYEKLLKRFEKSELMVVAYKTGLQYVEERLEFYKKNKSVYVEKINGLKWDIQVGEITIRELRKKLEIIVDNCKKGLGYNAVPPPLIGNFMPPKPDLSFTGLEEFTNEPVVIMSVVENSEAKASEARPKAVRKNNVPPPLTGNFMPPKPNFSFTGLEEFTNKPVIIKLVVENREAKASEAKPKAVRKNNGAPIIKDRVSDDEEEDDKRVIDSGCSRHMTGSMFYLTDYKEIYGGYVTFGGNPKGWKITGKGTIKTGNLDFKNVYFVRELKFNLFSVSQMCDKKNSVLVNDTECIVLSSNFKLIDESQVLLRVPRKNNMYSVDVKNIVPKRGLTCLFAKATSDESKL
ncbi:hypothetical protein Tco_0960339 [Tanacetum coccineum]